MVTNVMKKRILLMLQMLYTETDENHPVTRSDIEERLAENDITVDRKTFKSDIDLLTDMGFDIITQKSAPNLYFWGERSFQMLELKLMLDAVASSRFITNKKSKALSNKIVALASAPQGKQLKRHIVATGRAKATNENIYYIIDELTDAINDKKKISFNYYEYNGKKEKVLRGDGEEYILSPYVLYWNEDFYYVVGFSDKRQCITAFRVDRLCNVKITDEKAEKKPKGFKIEDYANKIFEMYAGDIAKVQLKCENSVMKYIIDRFGLGVETEVVDEEHFLTKVEVALSPTFFAL